MERLLQKGDAKEKKDNRKTYPIQSEADLQAIDLLLLAKGSTNIHNPIIEEPDTDLTQSAVLIDELTVTIQSDHEPKQSNTPDTIDWLTTSVIFAPKPERLKTPESRLGKQSQAERSPQTTRQTHSMSKKKKQSHDNILPDAVSEDSGQKQKRRPTRRHR